MKEDGRVKNKPEQFVRMDPNDNVFLMGWNGNEPPDLKGIISSMKMADVSDRIAKKWNVEGLNEIMHELKEPIAQELEGIVSTLQAIADEVNSTLSTTHRTVDPQLHLTRKANATSSKGNIVMYYNLLVQQLVRVAGALENDMKNYLKREKSVDLTPLSPATMVYVDTDYGAMTPCTFFMHQKGKLYLKGTPWTYKTIAREVETSSATPSTSNSTSAQEVETALQELEANDPRPTSAETLQKELLAERRPETPPARPVGEYHVSVMNFNSESEVESPPSESSREEQTDEEEAKRAMTGIIPPPVISNLYGGLPSLFSPMSTPTEKGARLPAPAWLTED